MNDLKTTGICTLDDDDNTQCKECPNYAECNDDYLRELDYNARELY